MTRTNGWFCVLRLFAIWNAHKILKWRFSVSDGCVRVCVFSTQISKNPSNEICQLQSKLHHLNTRTQIKVLMQKKLKLKLSWRIRKKRWRNCVIVFDYVSFKTSSKINVITSEWLWCTFKMLSFDCHCTYLWNFYYFHFYGSATNYEQTKSDSSHSLDYKYLYTHIEMKYVLGESENRILNHKIVDNFSFNTFKKNKLWSWIKPNGHLFVTLALDFFHHKKRTKQISEQIRPIHNKMIHDIFAIQFKFVRAMVFCVFQLMHSPTRRVCMRL